MLKVTLWLLLLVAPAWGQMMMTGAGKVGTAPALTISCAGTASTSSTVACSGTYTGSAPSSFASAVWQSPCSGSVTPPAATFTGGAWGPVNFPTPSGACTGALLVTTNIPTSATSGAVVVSGASTWSLTRIAEVPGSPHGGNSNTVDMTGVKVIGIAIGWYSGLGSTITPTDSSGNTYTCGAAQTIGATETWLCVKVNPTVTSSMTFTASAGVGNGYIAAEIAGWTESGTPTLGSFTGNTTASNSTTTGSTTPAADHALALTGFSTGYVGGSSSISPSGDGHTGYSITSQQPNVSGNNLSAALAWREITPISAQNPTWSSSGTLGTNETAASIVSISP